MNTSLNLK